MKIITALCFLLLSFNAHAQRLKVSGGLSFCKLDWRTVPGNRLFNKVYTGYTAGIGIEYLSANIIKLSSNIEYLQKGGTDEVTFTDAMGNVLHTHNRSAVFNFVHANTYARIKIPLKAKVKPFVSLGLYAGYMVSANKLAGDIDEYNRFNTGAVTGLGWSYKIIGREIGIEAQYLPSFTPLFNKPSATGATRKITDKTFTLKAFFVL